MASTSVTTPARPTKSQYHHFIPRFILRNFTHPGGTPQSSERLPRRRNKGKHQQEQSMLYTLDLSTPSPAFTETSVGHTFGLTDMYRDFAHANNQHYLEELLSKLESRAAEIILKIRRAFDAEERNVWLKRTERDILRKFLFVMKYRGSTMHSRFYHEDAEGYNADDKEKLLRYMQEKGFKKPVDVWFDNIKGLLELKMDPAGRWMHNIRERIYPDDAMWFISHTQMMYLALCTTSIEDDEFILSENGYSIHEGPNSYRVDPHTGEETPTAYTEYHCFAVVTPKLVMVLRSFLLPVLEEDKDEKIRNRRKTWYDENIKQHNFPLLSNSKLGDLPITKPRNSYSKIVDGRIVFLDGEDGTHRADHKFCFQFFPLETRHVQIINTIMLEQSLNIPRIVFKSNSGARRTLEQYLSMSSEIGFKYVPKISASPDQPRILFLEKLERVVKDMGSTVTASYQPQGPEDFLNREHDAWGEIFEENLPQQPTEFMRLYNNLGGSAKTLSKDLEQARRMLNMRIKIDVWSTGLDENLRESMRENVRDLFCQLPVRRVWFYLKQVQNIKLENRKVDGIEGSESIREGLPNGPEDVIAKVSYIIQSNYIARLMWSTVMNYIYLVQHPEIHLEAEIGFDLRGLFQLRALHLATFNPSGSICDCPSLKINEEARLWRSHARTRGPDRCETVPFWTVEENTELFVRRMIRDNFAKLLNSILPAADLQALETMLFTLTYPILHLRYSC